MIRQSITVSISLAAILYTSQAFSIFCPDNFNSINLGDSMQSVIQTCGSPLSQSTNVKKTYASQEYVYYVNGGFNQGTNTLRIIFNNDQIVNITLTSNVKSCAPLDNNGFESSQKNNNQCIPIISQRTQSLGSTSVCGSLISLGDSLQTVENACGQPVISNQQGSPSSQKTETVLLYGGPPPTKLIFEDGVLTNRVQGN